MNLNDSWKTPQESSIWVWLYDFYFVQLSLPLTLKNSNIFCFNKQFLVFHLKTQSGVFSEAMCRIHLISQTLYVIHANNFLSWVFKVGSWICNQEENFILNPWQSVNLDGKFYLQVKRLEHIYLNGVSRERPSLWREVTVLSPAGHVGLILNQKRQPVPQLHGYNFKAMLCKF